MRYEQEFIFDPVDSINEKIRHNFFVDGARKILDTNGEDPNGLTQDFGIY